MHPTAGCTPHIYFVFEDILNILLRLLEAKPRDDGKFFTDSKGKVHPLAPSPEAIKYAKKMGFKHTIGGKNLNFAKVAAKNVLHDAIMGASGGAATGWAVQRGKGAAVGAGLGALAGAVGGGAESAIKYKLLNKKPAKEQSKVISGVPYRTADAAYQGIASAVPAMFIGGILASRLKKNELLPLMKKYRMALKAGGKSTKAIALGKKVSNVKGKISSLGPISLASAAGQMALGTQDNITNEIVPAKLYGSDNPGAVGQQTYYYTDKTLGSGMFSGKKYKYLGLGPEAGKKKYRGKERRQGPPGRKK